MIACQTEIIEGIELMNDEPETDIQKMTDSEIKKRLAGWSRQVLQNPNINTTMAVVEIQGRISIPEHYLRHDPAPIIREYNECNISIVLRT